MSSIKNGAARVTNFNPQIRRAGCQYASFHRPDPKPVCKIKFHSFEFSSLSFDFLVSCRLAILARFRCAVKTIVFAVKHYRLIAAETFGCLADFMPHLF